MDELISRKKAFEYFVPLWEIIGTIMDRDEWEDVCRTTANEIPAEKPRLIAEIKVDGEELQRVIDKAIIHCRDCRFAQKTYDGYIKYCTYLRDNLGVTDEIYYDGDDFCSFAERREE